MHAEVEQDGLLQPRVRDPIPARLLRRRSDAHVAGIKVARHLTGSYVTSLEMAGCSISVTAVDAASLALWDAPVRTAVLRWGT